MTRFSSTLVAGLRRRSSATLAADASRLTGAIAQLGGDDRKLTRDFLEAYADRTWVFACISSEAKAMKQAPLLVSDPKPDKSGFIDIDDHPAVKLLRKPNPLTRGGLFREGMIIDLETTGNWYAEIVYSLDGVVPLELWRMDPSRTRIVVDQDTGLVAGYLYYPITGAKPTMLDATQVWHRRYANPLDAYRGVGPLSAARDAAIFDEASQKQINAYFQNGMRVSGVMTGPEKATPEEIKLARLMLERRHTGRAGHRALVLRGEWKYEAIGTDPKDIDWADGRQMSREDVCAAFNVPPPVAGDFTRSTYSNYEEAVKDFWQGNIAEKYQSLDEDLTNDILPLYPDTPETRVCRHDLSKIPAMSEDRDKTVGRAVAGFNGGLLTFNEGRAEIDADPADDGDFRRATISVREIPYGDDVPLLPPPPAPIAKPADPNAGPGDGGDPAPDVSADPAAEPPVDAKNGARGVAESGVTSTARASTGELVRRALQSHASDPAETRAQRTAHIVEACTSSLEAAVKENRDAVFALLSGGGHAERASKPTPPPGWSLLDLMHAISSSSWVWQALQKRITDVAGAAHQLAGEQAFEYASDLGLDASYNITDPVVALRLDQLASRPDGVSGMAAGVKQEILDLVSAGAKDGQTIDEIVEQIVGYYPQWTDEPWRAERVARTETAVAYNGAATDAYREAGFTHVVVSDGTDYDDACREADGEVWTLAEAEDNPIEHPNCVRAFAPALPEDVPA